MQASFLVRVELPAPISKNRPAFLVALAEELCFHARAAGNLFTDGEASVEVLVLPTCTFDFESCRLSTEQAKEG